MAVVRLQEPVGTTTGWLGATASDVFSAQVTTNGYPGDKPWATQWKVSCPLSDNNPNDFLTTTRECNTMGGQSGSGVWEMLNGSPTVRAVVSHGSSVSNGFVTLTTSRMWDVLGWAGGLYTPWNDAGSNDMYRNVWLDRHDVNCLWAQNSMSYFKLELRYNNPAVMRFNYECKPLRGASIGPLVRYTTPANDWGNGNTIFLDRHNVRCPANQVLRRWRLFRPQWNQIAFEFWCSTAPLVASTCENLATPWNSQGNGRVNFLDRHAVACPGSKVLTEWRLENDGRGQYRIAYQIMLLKLNCNVGAAAAAVHAHKFLACSPAYL